MADDGTTKPPASADQRSDNEAAPTLPADDGPDATEPEETEARSSVRLSHGELTQRVLEMTSGPSRLVEEPIDTGLWPTGQLSDAETSLFAAALRRHKRAA